MKKPIKKIGGATVAKGDGAKPATALVTVRHYKDGKILTEKDKPITLKVLPFVGPTATVGLNAGHTQNLGENEFVKIGALVSLPCHVEEIEEAKAAASALVEKFMTEELANVSEKGEVEESDEAEETEEGEAEEGEAEEGETKGEDTEISEAAIKKMKRAELVELLKENPELGIKSVKFSKDEAGRKKLAAAIIKAIAETEESGETEEGESEEGEAEDETEEGEGEAEEGEGDGEGYTEEELNDSDEKTLKEIFKEWEMGEYPKGPPTRRKERAVKRILAFQESGGE